MFCMPMIKLHGMHKIDGVAENLVHLYRNYVNIHRYTADAYQANTCSGYVNGTVTACI